MNNVAEGDLLEVVRIELVQELLSLLFCHSDFHVLEESIELFFVYDTVAIVVLFLEELEEAVKEQFMLLECVVLHYFRQLRVHKSYGFEEPWVLMRVPCSAPFTHYSLVEIFFLRLFAGSHFCLLGLQAFC